MFLRTLMMLLFLVSGNGHTFQFPVEIIEYMDDTKIVLSIYESDIDESLRWTPSDGAPPLTIANVIEDIHAYTISNPLLSNAEIKNVELKQIPHHRDHWHYLVVMQVDHDGKARLHYFGVLMNHKIIPAIKEPASVK